MSKKLCMVHYFCSFDRKSLLRSFYMGRLLLVFPLEFFHKSAGDFQRNCAATSYQQWLLPNNKVCKNSVSLSRNNNPLSDKIDVMKYYD